MKKYFLLFLLMIGISVPLYSGTKEQKKEEKKEEERKKKEEKKIQKTRANQERWKALASLSCPMGGYEEVFINPDFGRELGRWNGSGFTGFIGHRYTMVIRATNPYTNLELQISSNGNVAVSRMCPGGSISLAKSAPSGNSYSRVIWTAEGFLEGRIAHGYYSPGDVINGGYEAVAIRQPWVMRLDRIDQEF